MMNLLRALLYVMFTFFLSSCQRNNTIHSSKINESDQFSTLKLVDSSQSAISDLIKKIPLKKLPYTDSTNFDNFKRDGIINNDLLAHIGFKIENDIDSIYIRYQIPVSEFYTILVISYFKGEHELFTDLLNIDHNHKLIYKINIAYDEIAESALRTESTISKEKIWTQFWNYYTEGDPIMESRTLKFDKAGKLILEENSK